MIIPQLYNIFQCIYVDIAGLFFSDIQFNRNYGNSSKQKICCLDRPGFCLSLKWNTSAAGAFRKINLALWQVSANEQMISAFSSESTLPCHEHSNCSLEEDPRTSSMTTN